MTREEIIHGLYRGDSKAIKEAIKTLEQEPCLVSQGLAKDSQGFSQEHCDDAISRQAALYGLASIAKAKAKSDAQKALMGRVMFFVGQLPPVTPQPKAGHWIKVPGEETFFCSKCNARLYDEQIYLPFNYCPNCGAKMIEPQERNDKE